MPHDADFILRIDPKDDSTSLVGPDLKGKKGAKYLGAVSDNEGCVYIIPHEADNVIKITPPAAEGGELRFTLLDTNLSDFGDRKFVR